MLSRRGLLAGLIAAPIVIRSPGLLMPVKAFALPEPFLPCDGRRIDRRHYPALFDVLKHVPDFLGVVPSLGLNPGQRWTAPAPGRLGEFVIATGEGSQLPAGVILCRTR